ncbi:hypothetical protein [Streptomyces sp. NPDC002187]|uniref:hypothetical protein n=1 Tax=Streptomyces sp. NPDC002187 TaxID=3364637 RepID=UPI0036C76AB1
MPAAPPRPAQYAPHPVAPPAPPAAPPMSRAEPGPSTASRASVARAPGQAARPVPPAPTAPPARVPQAPPARPAADPAARAEATTPWAPPSTPTGSGAGIPDAETTTRLRPIGGAGTPPPGPPLPPQARRRPVGTVDMTPRPGAPRPPVHAWAPPETPAEMTTRLRPVRTRHPARTVSAVACVVLGLGLIGGAVTGSWLTGSSSADSATGDPYAEAGSLWHSVPVDTLFPRTLKGPDAGPGGADRVWTRVAVAPAGGCATALDPLLVKTLEPVGCSRVLRATYTDATATSVTTVGMVFTKADKQGMRALGDRFTAQSLGERTDLMPRTLGAEKTVAAKFGKKQRASWTVDVMTEAPVVVYAVSGFADGRTVTDPQPADEAKAAGATSAPAQAGLGHDADGIATAVKTRLRTAFTAAATEKPE